MTDREALGQVIRIAYLKAMGGGPELIAFAQSRDDDPETRQRWHQIADAVLSYVEPPADPYAHLTADERHALAFHARELAQTWRDGTDRYERWREIADGLHSDRGVTDG